MLNYRIFKSNDYYNDSNNGTLDLCKYRLSQKPQSIFRTIIINKSSYKQRQRRILADRHTDKKAASRHINYAARAHSPQNTGQAH